MATFVTVTGRNNPQEKPTINLDNVTQLIGMPEGYTRVIFERDSLDVVEDVLAILKQAGAQQGPTGRWKVD